MKRVSLCILFLGLSLFVYPQASLFVALSGGLKIIDQDNRSAFYPDGSGYDILTIRAVNESGTCGFGMTDENLLSKLTYIKSVTGVDTDLDGQYDEILTTTGTTNSFDIRDWNVWYRLLDGRVRISIGQIRNSDYRTTLPNWYVETYGGTDLVNAQGLLVQAYPVKGLSLGVFLPIGTSNQDFLNDTLAGADIGASWSIPNVGIVKALVRMGQDYSLDIDDDGDETGVGEAVTDALMVNAGFVLTAVDGLVASVLGRVMRSGTADATFFYAAAGADYEITPKWAARAEVGYALRPEFSGDCDAEILGAFWDVWTRVRYRITDNLYTHATVTFDRGGDFCVKGALGYAFEDGLGVSAHLGYDGGLLYDLYAYYAVAF